MDPQTSSYYDLHICPHFQPPPPVVLALRAHLSVRLSGRGFDRSHSGLDLPRSGPPQQRIQGPGPRRQPPVAPTPADTGLFTSTRCPSLPLGLSAVCLGYIRNAATFPIKGGNHSANSRVCRLLVNNNNTSKPFLYLLFLISGGLFHGPRAGVRPVFGLQDCRRPLRPN